MIKNKYILFIIAFVLTSAVCFGQSKQDKNKIKKEEKALQKKIEKTKNLIKLTKNKKK